MKKHFMKKNITPLTWEHYLRKKLAENKLQAIDDYFFISDNLKLLPLFPYPFKINVVISFFCERGKLVGKIGMKKFEAVAPCMVILPKDEILQFDSVSDDIEGKFNVLSATLADELISHIRERMEISLSVSLHPVISWDEEELTLNKTYFYLLKSTMNRSDNPHLKDAIRYLLLSLYYQQHPDISSFSDTVQISKQEDTFIRFMELVK